MKQKQPDKFVYRDYWNADGTYTPYRSVVHSSEDDSEVGQWYVLEKMFEEAGLSDGDEFEIIIRKTGKRPFPNVKWMHTAHTYEPVETKDTPHE